MRDKMLIIVFLPSLRIISIVRPLSFLQMPFISHLFQCVARIRFIFQKKERQEMEWVKTKKREREKRKKDEKHILSFSFHSVCVWLCVFAYICEFFTNFHLLLLRDLNLFQSQWFSVLSFHFPFWCFHLSFSSLCSF